MTTEPAFVKPFPWMPSNPHDWSFEDSGHLAYFSDHVAGLKGYDLLDTFFPGYGDAFTARTAGLLTGTPYGPVDFLSIDKASPQTLQSYRLSVFLGETTLDAGAKQRLMEAAEAGQTVVVGAEQLGADLSNTPRFAGFGCGADEWRGIGRFGLIEREHRLDGDRRISVFH